MWQIFILILVSINLISSDTSCPDLSKYQNNATLLANLNEEYMAMFTTSDYVLECERIKWTRGLNSNLTANLKDSAGCCRKIDNFDSSNTNCFNHDITNLTTCTHLKGTENVQQKLIASTGTGQDLCLIVYICHPSRNGLIVACRKPPQPSLLIAIGQILVELFSLIIPIPVLRMVNQINCLFPKDCGF